jgi:flavin reductase (DIM6/NTAB) family NADH-FMN oxidoreductase RutF
VNSGWILAQSRHDGDVDNDPFEQMAGMLNYTMFVVTTQADGHPSGCLVGFATQTSIDPHRFLAGLSKKNHTARVAAQADHLAVHVVGRRHVDLVRLFGGQTGDEVDKFERCSWHTGPQGMPILDDAAAWFVGKTLQRIDFGDHTGYLLEPVDGAADQHCAEELVSFSDIADMEPGHEA